MTISEENRNAFTLIELLVVIAIIAILSIVVVLSLNPAEMLRQSRDSNRSSDLDTLTHALNLYQTDQSVVSGSGPLGSSTLIYLSLPDSSSTCGFWNLPAAPSGYSYQCAPTSSYRNTNGSGWIPVNLASTTTGSPLGQLPIDPVNASSSGLYYAYTTNGTQYEVTSLFESSKYKAQSAQNPSISSYPEVNAKGSSLTLNPLFNPSGLVGYWPMDEGVGSTTQDMSGNGNTGTWFGTPSGASGTYYGAGKVGSWAGYFNGSNDEIGIGNLGATPSQGTISFWANAGVIDSVYRNMLDTDPTAGNSVFRFEVTPTGGFYAVLYGGAPCNYLASGMQTGQWYHAVLTWNTIIPRVAGYLNGSQVCINTSAGVVPPTIPNLVIGAAYSPRYWSGLLDDVRIYSRALSAAEISALYNAEK